MEVNSSKVLLKVASRCMVKRNMNHGICHSRTQEASYQCVKVCYLVTSQGLLSFEVSTEGVEDNSLTEAAMDDFEEASLSDESAEDGRQKFSQQVQIYAQNKPRKKKNTDRESLSSVR